MISRVNRAATLTVAALFATTAILAPLPAVAKSWWDPFGLFTSEDDEVDDEIADPVTYSVEVTVQPDVEGIEDAVRAASTLVADEDEAVSGSLGLLAKARNDRRRIVAALYESARYDGLVTILIEGQDIATLEPDATFNTAGTVPVSIRVDPGQLYTLAPPRLVANGVAIDSAAYELEAGGNAGSVEILQAETRFLNDLRDTGRPFVAVTDRSVIADSATGLLEFEVETSPGEQVPFGLTSVTGAEAVRPGFIAYMGGIEPGTIYSVAEIEEARERLVGLGVFSSVTVRAADAQGSDGTLPVNIEVSERAFNTIGAGATFSNTEGAGANAYYERRNLFGQAESLRLEAAVSRVGANELSQNGREIDGIDFRGAAVFRKPGVLGPDSVYVGSLIALREQPLAYNRESVALRNGVEYKLSDRQSVTAALNVEYEIIEDYLSERDFFITSVPLTYQFDGRDDELNPTEGFLAKLTAEPAFDALNSTPFVTARGDVSAYFSFDEEDRFIVAGRAAYGTVLGADLEDVPNSRRFYAGGGGSVRGYTFQSIGPYYPSFPLPDTNDIFVDTPIGGLSVFEASAELRIGITENIQLVPFIDGGTVSDDLVPDFGEFKLGAGVGARYITSFGPIRVDVGIPLDPGPRDGSFQIYAGIGQAF